MIFFMISYALLWLVRETGVEDSGRLLTCGEHPKLQALVSTMQVVFLFGVVVIMLAGAASLGKQLVGIPLWCAGAVFALVVFLAALLGVQGMMAAFQFLVPVTTLCAVVIGIATWINSGAQAAGASGSVSTFLPNWVVGSLAYAAYNLFATLGILIPIGRLLPDWRVLRRGLGAGSAVLALLAGSIIGALTVRPEAGAQALPMVTLAGELHPAFVPAYGVLMGLGMFSGALGSLVAILHQLELKFKPLSEHRVLTAAALSAAAYVAGFGNLVGTVYPIFGYASIPFLLCLVKNFVSHRKTIGEEEAQ